jgi:hypothetical protein
MKDRVIETSLLALVLAVAIGSTANAALVTVATWTSNPNTGGGPLVLNGSLGGNPVTLTTVAVPPNAGIGLVENWTATPATNGYVTGQVPTSGNTSIAIAEGASTLETLAFGLALTNPVLLISFADPTVTYNYDGLSVTLLSANHASLAGNILSFPGATDSDADGAAVQINGTFSSLSFTAADAGGRTDTQRFTVATAVAAAVPEPSSLILGGIAAAVFILGCAWRERLRRGSGSERAKTGGSVSSAM